MLIITLSVRLYIFIDAFIPVYINMCSLLFRRYNSLNNDNESLTKSLNDALTENQLIRAAAVSSGAVDVVKGRLIDVRKPSDFIVLSIILFQQITRLINITFKTFIIFRI